MINEFIENFRQKHGFNRHTAMLPYVDKEDSDGEPIELEGGRKMVIQRRIISPRGIYNARGGSEQACRPRGMTKEGAQCPDLMGSIGPLTGKKLKKTKHVKTPKPEKDPKPKKPKKGKKSRRTAESSEPGDTPGPKPNPRPGDTDT